MTCVPRMNRLFGRDGRCFDVAVDHGFFNERSFLAGIESMSATLDLLVDAAPDAIQLTVGQARLLQDRPGPKPSLVLRTDAANVYGSTLPRNLFSEVIAQAVEAAVALDAACVVVNLLLLPDQPQLHQACVRNVMDLRARCERMGMPLMVEPLVMQPNQVAGGYMVDGDIDKILPLVRQAVELGADIIKADPTDDVTQYHRVIEVSGRVPVLVRGGGKVSTEEILARTAALMKQGAAGIVYGRNILQADDPRHLTGALMNVVHGGSPTP
jgi:fructose-bisphosphate aldolase, class I